MTQVREKVKVCVDDRRREVPALFDAGARGTFISDRLAREIRFKPTEGFAVLLAVEGKVGGVVGI